MPKMSIPAQLGHEGEEKERSMKAQGGNSPAELQAQKDLQERLAAEARAVAAPDSWPWPMSEDAKRCRALIDRFPRLGGGKTPQIGTKAQPGPLYGLTSHT